MWFSTSSRKHGILYELLVHGWRVAIKSKSYYKTVLKSNTVMSAGPVNRSLIWDYFEINPFDTNKANCNTCGAKISRGGKSARSYNTSNLIGHLESKHNEVFSAYKLKVQEVSDKKRKQAEDSDSSYGKNKQVRTSQPTIQDAFNKTKPWQSDDPRNRSIHKYLGEMIVLDNQPFSIVEDKGFRRFTNTLEPRYVPPTRRYISDTLIPDMYDKVLVKVKERINSAEYISFTSDSWSSPNESFLSLTAQWITADFLREQTVLHVSPLKGRHIGEVLSKKYDGMLKLWDINKSRVHVILRDNATNMARATDIAGLTSLGCFAHTNQLIINESLLTQRAVIDITGIGRNIATHFNHSLVAKEELHKIQAELGLPMNNIRQDVQTRWNSTYLMLQSLWNQKRALIMYASEYDLQMFTANQWSLVEKLITALEPWYEVTLEVSKNSSSAGDIIPLVKSLKALTEQSQFGLGTMQTTMTESLSKRFSNIETNKVLAMATILDPRFKMHFFSTSQEVVAAMVKVWLKEDLSENNNNSSECGREPQPQTSATDSQSTQDPVSSNSLLWGAFDTLASTSSGEPGSDNPSKPEAAEEELLKYLQVGILPRKDDPLKWWREHQHLYPCLATLARKYLSAPSTSVQSEQLFSAAGNVYTNKRQSLKGLKAEMILFLKYNLQLLNFNY